VRENQFGKGVAETLSLQPNAFSGKGTHISGRPQVAVMKHKAFLFVPAIVR
jgi:hypothetical protein